MLESQKSNTNVPPGKPLPSGFSPKARFAGTQKRNVSPSRISCTPSKRPLMGTSLSKKSDCPPNEVDKIKSPFDDQPLYKAVMFESGVGMVCPVPGLICLYERPEAVTLTSPGGAFSSSGGFGCLSTLYISMSKTSGPPGLAAPSPASPKASAGGTQKRRVSPGAIICKPSVHPGMTELTLTSFFSRRLLSNIFPLGFQPV
mmetsp:Transcript_28952/g.96439  ORF Transcript_28952/g.96439 Transcript_28952/m.96439 type:complete len:201 (-) Transcript_28952:476-1078(-)